MLDASLVGQARGTSMSAPERGSVSFAHISGPHFGAHDDLLLDGLTESVRALAIVASVITGDLTMRARHREFVPRRGT